MFRVLFTSVLTLAAFFAVALDVRADYGVFSWSPAAKKWTMTQKYKNKAHADSAAATCKRLGMQVYVSPATDAVYRPQAVRPSTPALPPRVVPAPTPVPLVPFTRSGPANIHIRIQVTLPHN